MYCSSPLSLFHLCLLSREWKRSTHPLENFLCVPSYLSVTQTFTSDVVSRLLVQFLIVSIFCYLNTCQPACETLAQFLLSLHKWHTDTTRTRLLLQGVHDSQKSVQLMVLENKNLHFKVNVQALQESKKKNPIFFKMWKLCCHVWRCFVYLHAFCLCRALSASLKSNEGQ